MSIQLIITGEYPTDLLSQLHQLTSALTAQAAPVDSVEVNVPNDIQPAKKRTIGKRRQVQQVVATEEVAVVSESSVTPKAESEVIDHDALRELVTKKGKKENGETDPAKYAAMRNILKGYVPVEEEAKIANVPLDKVKEVYYAISAM